MTEVLHSCTADSRGMIMLTKISSHADKQQICEQFKLETSEEELHNRILPFLLQSVQNEIHKTFQRGFF